MPWGLGGYGTGETRPLRFPVELVQPPNGNEPAKGGCNGCGENGITNGTKMPTPITAPNGTTTRVLVEARPITHQIFIGVVVGVILYLVLKKKPSGIVA